MVPYTHALEKPFDIVKQRQNTMAIMGKKLNTILDMIKGKTSFDVIIMVEAADRLFDHSLTAAKQFPDPTIGSNETLSRALPVIWKHKDQFDRLFTDLQDQAELLAQFAAGGNDTNIRIQFAETVELCSSCHEKFRKPK